MEKIEEVFSYQETNNPYANGETINITSVKKNSKDRWFEISVRNDYDDGCSIFLTKDQITDLIQKLNYSNSTY